MRVTQLMREIHDFGEGTHKKNDLQIASNLEQDVDNLFKRVESV